MVLGRTGRGAGAAEWASSLSRLAPVAFDSGASRRDQLCPGLRQPEDMTPQYPEPCRRNGGGTATVPQRCVHTYLSDYLPAYLGQTTPLAPGAGSL